MSFKIYRDLIEGEFLVAGYDMAMGGNDYSAVVFVSKTLQDVPIIYHSRETATITTNRILPVLSKIYQATRVKPTIAPETNAGGVYEIDRMRNSPNASDFTLYTPKSGIGTMDVDMSNKYGWTTSTATRPKMLEELKNAIDNRLLTVNDKQLITEMFSFIINKTTSGWKAQAEQNAHDDLVMALAIAWQLYQTEQKPLSSNQVFTRDFNKYRIG